MAFINEDDEVSKDSLVKEANKILSNGKLEKHAEKKSKKTKPKKDLFSNDIQVERKLRVLTVHPETLKVYALVDHETIMAPQEEDGENVKFTEPKSVSSNRRPHKDLINKIGKLVKHAMALGEIEDENASDYYVGSIKIDGDMLMKKSRVTLTIMKFVERTGKYLKISLGQCVMYGDSNYHDSGKMAKIIEEIEEEAMLYLFSGKYEIETPNQLPLFT